MKLFRSIIQPNRAICTSMICALFGLATLSFPAHLLAQSGRVQHTIVTSATDGKALTIEASVQGAMSLPVEGRTYYRSYDQDAFSYVEMRVSQDRLSAEIPGKDVKEGRLDYYIEATLENETILTFPEGAPTTADPLSIEVRPIRAGLKGSGNAFLILSPEPGEKLLERRALIAVTLLPHVQELDPDAIRLDLDGKDITAALDISSEMIYVVKDNLSKGKHSVSIFYENQKVKSWNFSVLSEKEARQLPGQLKGKITTGYSHEDISSKIRNITYFDGRVSGEMSKLEWNGRAYITSLERGYLQPQNRFKLTGRYGGLKLQIGDTQPRLSEFTVWGSRSRGVNLALHSPVFNLDVAWGSMRRSIDGFSDTTHVVGSAGQDSIIVDRRNGTFNRKLLAIRPGFPLSAHSALSFTVMKIKDDIESIDDPQNTSPKDNVVIGTDLRIQSNNRRIIFNSEFAISGYNSDITDGPDSDVESLEKFIVINKNFVPLPSDSSFLNEDLGTSELARKMFDELSRSSMAHRTTLTLNYFKNEVRFGYRTIGKSFYSLGSPTVETDIKGISIQDRVRLMNNRLYFTLGFEAYTDNVNGRSETTTDRDVLRAGISYYSPPQYPNISFGMRKYDQANDGDLTRYITGTDTAWVDNRYESKQSMLNISIDQNFRYGGFDHIASLTISNSATEDVLQPTANSDLNTFNLALNSNQPGLETGISFSSTGQTSRDGLYTVDYTDLGFNGRYMILPDKLWLSAGLSFTFAGGDNDELSPTPADTLADSLKAQIPSAFKLDYSRTKFSFGARYLMTDMHQFNLSIYKVGHSDDSYTEYFSGRQELFKDLPEFVEQNDFVTRLTYTLKF